MATSVLGGVLLCLAATGCSSSGDPAPNNTTLAIVAAAFVGATATPAPGDSLLLTFGSDIAVSAGANVDDMDLTLSSGGSLGDQTAPPTVENGRSLRVTLGNNVSITPGTTTITVAATNDLIQITGGGIVTGSDTTVILAGDGDAPTLSAFGLSSITADLNGTGAAGGTLQIPANGFDFALTFSDPTTAVDPSRTIITSNQTVQAGGATQSAGTNLVPFLTLTDATQTSASWTVPGSVALPAGATTFEATIADASGMLSTSSTASVTVRPFTDALQPFETTANANQIWFLDLSRDIESFTVNLSSSANPVQVVNTANGRPDLEDMLFVLGMQSSTPIGNVSGTMNSNQVALGKFQDSLKTELDAFYAGAPIVFTFTSPGAFPAGPGFAPYNSFGFSQICIAGSADTTGTSGVLGVAIFDPNNTTQDNDCVEDFQMSGTRLGVFLHTIVDDGFASSPASLFRMTYDPLAPDRAGTPIGNDPLDGDRLNGTLTDVRSMLIDAAIARMARFAAVVAAHECGHSVGLVEDGPMPNGLYGGDSFNFPGSSSGHIRNDFTPGTNIMSPSLGFNSTLDAATGFNSLNRAYLQQKAFYGS